MKTRVNWTVISGIVRKKEGLPMLWFGTRTGAIGATLVKGERLEETEPGNWEKLASDGANVVVRGRILFPQETHRQYDRTWLKEVFALGVTDPSGAYALRMQPRYSLVRQFSLFVVVDSITDNRNMEKVNEVILTCKADNVGKKAFDFQGLDGLMFFACHQTIERRHGHGPLTQTFNAYSNQGGVLAAIGSHGVYHLQGEAIFFPAKVQKKSEEFSQMMAQSEGLTAQDYGRLQKLMVDESLPSCAVYLTSAEPGTVIEEEINFPLTEVKMPSFRKSEYGYEVVKPVKVVANTAA